MNIPLLRFKSKVKGFFSSSPSIPYNPLIESGDSSPFFGTYESQKFWRWDTSCCWNYSGCEIAETRLEILVKNNLIPKDTMDWLIANRYIDETGDFYLSRRWVAILSGVRDAGNQQLNFWQIAQGAGLIPNWMLPFNQNEAYKDMTQSDFDNDYFNPQAITLEMENLGKEFARRFTILAENLSGGQLQAISTELQTYLKEGSMQIGIPVPDDVSVWNSGMVKWDGKTIAQHAVELYKFDPTQAYPYFIYDTYEPHLKQLSADYPLIVITRVSIMPVPQQIPPNLPPASPVVNSWAMFWANVQAWITGKPIPYPSVPVGTDKV